MSAFSFSPDVDPQELSAEFTHRRRVRIAGVLAPGQADALIDNVAARDDWAVVINAGGKVYDVDPAAVAAMSEAERAQFDQKVMDAAKQGFQFRFASVRVPDAVGERSPDDLLHQFVEFMSGNEATSLLRAVAKAEDIVFADGQATAYRPGDFLTAHNDSVEGKDRRLAYVLGLTRAWRADWGGLLQFHDGDHVRGRLPGFNTLDLFEVPQMHGVSLVAPFAGATRYAITGWLRTKRP